MRKRLAVICLIGVIFPAVLAYGAGEDSKMTSDVSVTVDVSAEREPISKYIYGQFIEHSRPLHLRRHLGGDAGRPEILLSH